MSEAHTRYIGVADTIALHNEALERSGSRPAPLRDEGLLESAVLRPQMAAYYERADLIRQAALLAVAISQAQAFVDGNKRTAFAVFRVFLNLNGLRYVGDPIEIAYQLEAVAERRGNLDEATTEFERWLRERVLPRSSD